MTPNTTLEKVWSANFSWTEIMCLTGSSFGIWRENTFEEKLELSHSELRAIFPMTLMYVE